jgi:hypothetical protein
LEASWRSKPHFIARKDGEQVRIWARTTSDYSKAFTRMRDALAALPVKNAVAQLIFHVAAFDSFRSSKLSSP